jgi:hypothetical protein
MGYDEDPMRPTAHRHLLPALALLLAAACGGVTSSQDAARSSATTASCDWYQMCGQIGPGLQYTDRSDCEVKVQAYWENAWPPATCDQKINQSALSVCLDAIHATTCGSGLDVLATLGVKCPASSVCTGP